MMMDMNEDILNTKEYHIKGDVGVTGASRYGRGGYGGAYKCYAVLCGGYGFEAKKDTEDIIA